MTNLFNDFSECLLHTEGDNFFEIESIKSFALSTIIYGKVNFLVNEIEKLNDNGFIKCPIIFTFYYDYVYFLLIYELKQIHQKHGLAYYQLLLN